MQAKKDYVATEFSHKLGAIKVKLVRFDALVNECISRFPNDSFFNNYEERKKDDSVRYHYEIMESELVQIDENNWIKLKQKAFDHFQGNRKGALKQDFYNHLNEVKGYLFLKSFGCINIDFIEESDMKSPDLVGQKADTTIYCEVKTMCVSDEEIERRKGNEAYKNAYQFLGTGFFNKLDDAFTIGSSQLESVGNEIDMRMIYFDFRFDDFVLDYESNYWCQINDWKHKYSNSRIGIEINDFRRNRKTAPNSA